MKITIVIPARNEELSIAATVRAALAWGRVIVVDDQSTDSTAAVATAQGATVIPSPVGRRGLSDVYRHGLLAAVQQGDADWIFEIDAGGSHDPSEVVNFLGCMYSELEVVFGRRFGARSLYAGPWQRRLLSWLGTVATNLRYGYDFQDATSGFIAYSRAALASIHATPFEATGHYYQTEVRIRAAKAGLSWDEVPISFRTTKSTLRWPAIREALRLAFK